MLSIRLLLLHKTNFLSTSVKLSSALRLWWATVERPGMRVVPFVNPETVMCPISVGLGEEMEKVKKGKQIVYRATTSDYPTTTRKDPSPRNGT